MTKTPIRDAAVCWFVGYLAYGVAAALNLPVWINDFRGYPHDRWDFAISAAFIAWLLQGRNR